MTPSFRNLLPLASSPEGEIFPLASGRHQWPKDRPIAVTFLGGGRVVASEVVAGGEFATVVEGVSAEGRRFSMEVFEGGRASLVSSLPSLGVTLRMRPEGDVLGIRWEGASEGVSVDAPPHTRTGRAARVVIQSAQENHTPTLTSVQRLLFSESVEGVIQVSRLSVSEALRLTGGSAACELRLKKCGVFGAEISTGKLSFGEGGKVFSGRIHVETLDAGTSYEDSAEALRNVEVHAKTVVFNGDWLGPLPDMTCCIAPQGLVTRSTLFCLCGAQVAKY